MNIVQQPNFLKNLEKLVETNDRKYYDYIGSHQSKIPLIFRTISSPLYRGMILDSELVNSIKTRGKSLTLDKVSSWSLSEKVAFDFVSSPKFRIGKTGENRVGIIFKYSPKQNEVVLNIHGLISYLQTDGTLDQNGFDELAIDSVMKEQEVILQDGVKLFGRHIRKKISL